MLIEPFTAKGSKVVRNNRMVLSINPSHRHAAAFAVLVAVALNEQMKEILYEHV